MTFLASLLIAMSSIAPSPTASEQASETVTRVTRSEGFRISDEFLPVLPYLDCLSFSSGVPVFRNGLPIKPTVEKGSSCARHRDAAARNANEKLRQKGIRSGEERRARVEAFLREADARFGPQRPRRFQMPPQIARQVSPYVGCRLRGGSCQTERTNAMADADAALAAAGTMGAEERKAFIARTLGEIDLFTGGIVPVSAAPVGDINRLQERAFGTGISFEMDSAVAPGVRRYSDCLTRASQRQPQARETITGIAQRAIAECKATRNQSMAEADAALAAKPGWKDKAKREAEVRSAFDNTDASTLKLAQDTEAHFSKMRR